MKLKVKVLDLGVTFTAISNLKSSRALTASLLFSLSHLIK